MTRHAPTLTLILTLLASGCAATERHSPAIVGLRDRDAPEDPIDPGDPGEPADPCAGFACGRVMTAEGWRNCGAHMLDQHNALTNPPIRLELCEIGRCSDLSTGGTCDRACTPGPAGSVGDCGAYGTCDPEIRRCVRHCSYYAAPTNAPHTCGADHVWRRSCTTHTDCGTLQRCASDGTCRPDVCDDGTGCERPGYVCRNDGTCHPGCALPDYYGNTQTCEAGTFCEASSGQCRACDCPAGSSCNATTGACTVTPSCETTGCPADQYCREGACRSRCELCPPGSTCTNGFCGAVDPCVGVVCSPGATCSGGRCSDACDSSFDCNAGLACLGGRCVLDEGGGTGCALDGRCDPDETCPCEAFCCVGGGGGGGGGGGTGHGCDWGGGPEITYEQCADCGGSIEWTIGGDMVCEMDPYLD